MWTISSWKNFLKAASLYDRFISLSSRSLLKNRKSKTFRPEIVVLEDRIVPTGWPTSNGFELVTVVPWLTPDNSAPVQTSPTIGHQSSLQNLPSPSKFVFRTFSSSVTYCLVDGYEIIGLFLLSFFIQI